MKNKPARQWLFVPVIIVLLACNLPSAAQSPTSQPAESVGVTPLVTVEPPAAIATATASVVHVNSPALVSTGKLIYDVESSGTAPEKRAPYGDSYDIDRLERPFLADMTYVSDLDIASFIVGEDDQWYYVSVKLIGKDPNNALGINYGIELDTNHDGFGDYAIVANPPYAAAWETSNVNIYQDTNHDTAGVRAEKSDAPISTNGYDAQIFHGGVGDADPDLAWVRLGTTPDSQIEFAFKKSWSGQTFMLGVFADAGLKDVAKLDYVDRFTEEEAGSPVKDKKYYPLKALYAVDNTCQEAFGFSPSGYEPKLCPRTAPAPHNPQSSACVEPGSYSDQASCEAAGCAWRQNGGVVIAVIYYCTYP
ncbi:MAG: hypothetical protein IT310_08365 [Anaerolineales bacterium]|nr:hypothetical protein [Anaerolineales bacterium]